MENEKMPVKGFGDERPSQFGFRELAANTMRNIMTPAQKARAKAEEIYNAYWSDVNRKNIRPSDPLPDIRPLIEKALLEFPELVKPKPDVQTAIELRDRATQVALNFVGHSISSSDGSYSLLVDCIAAELDSAFEDGRASQVPITASAEREECGKIVQKTYQEWLDGEHGPSEAFRLARDRIRARSEK